MKILRKKYYGPIFYGVLAIVATLLINDKVYYKIQHPSNSSVASTGGKVFYALIHYIDKYLGLWGVYACFILIAGLFFLKAYKMYRNENRNT